MGETVLEAIKNSLDGRCVSRIVAGVSGGPDSMALLHGLYTLSLESGLKVEVAHFNHMLRPTAKRDEDIVNAFCEERGIKLHIAAGDIGSMAGNTEDNAREGRYTFMLGLLGEGDVLMTAHHQGDLAESVLMNIIRGTGTRGLIGMAEERDNILRPLLHISKTDIDEYVHSNNIPFGLDETNASTDYTRNRVRLELIPKLKDDYNPRIVEALERVSRHAAEDEDYLLTAAKRIAGSIAVEAVGDFYRGLDGNAIAAQHPAIGKRLIRMLLESMGLYDIDEAAMNAAFATMAGGRTDIGRGIFAKGGERAEIYRRRKVDGQIDLVSTGSYESDYWLVNVETVPMPGIFFRREDWTQYVNIRYIDKIQVRGRQQGDRVRFTGGSKKLGDIMTDSKAPVALRDVWPVVCCGGELLWVPGLAMAESAMTTGGDTAIKISVGWNNKGVCLGEFGFQEDAAWQGRDKGRRH